MVDERAFDAADPAGAHVVVRLDAAATTTAGPTRHSVGDEEVHRCAAAADPGSGLWVTGIEVEPGGAHRLLDQRSRREKLRVDGEVGVLGLGRDRFVDVAGA